MGLSIGIVGLPNVGKSTLFNALTKKSVPAENYPFCTIDPSVGIVQVPDERLWKLSELSKSAKTIPAAVEFTDIAGLVKGASEGEGLGNQFLSHIREVDAIAQVVRVFPARGGSASGGEDVIHIYGDINPMRDVEIINLELILADMQSVTKRRANILRDVKRGDKAAAIEDGILAKVEVELEAGRLASTVALDEAEKEILKSMHLLSAKPILYVLNKKSGAKLADTTELMKYITASGAQFVEVDAGIENELSALSDEDKGVFRAEYDAKDDGVNDLIRQSYKLLGLMTYFTTGTDETRGWTVKVGATGPEAGMAIHTDFKEKFIRAEVVAYDKLIEAGSYATAREKGWVRTEGKEYIVKDGDVIEFKI
ncbi:MAG: redox-regulated ATPase YchF [Candidatus Vogelbacteria bacterium RIFOXYD1_FULL_44_32]|uniref:Redox-regulated ATPase YchF n=1 Tax=Candidatus Vogelbacteria bacterium RIFOXYD1_FULL_44_32 TaxID=1802438 RepID=A0A1G2QDF0_9BACT|nr:MAG: redox-regulated ATPase YchF [Candidatus Vogelbacteria bacterium RIFOXYD1_FULL_44_32]